MFNPVRTATPVNWDFILSKNMKRWEIENSTLTITTRYWCWLPPEMDLRSKSTEVHSGDHYRGPTPEVVFYLVFMKILNKSRCSIPTSGLGF